MWDRSLSKELNFVVIKTQTNDIIGFSVNLRNAGVNDGRSVRGEAEKFCQTFIKYYDRNRPEGFIYFLDNQAKRIYFRHYGFPFSRIVAFELAEIDYDELKLLMKKVQWIHRNIHSNTGFVFLRQDFANHPVVYSQFLLL